MRFDVDVRTVEPEDGRIPIERMIGAMDERTRLVTVPTVTFSPGFVTAVEPLAAVCRERGVISVVDAAQSVGVLPARERLATATVEFAAWSCRTQFMPASRVVVFPMPWQSRTRTPCNSTRLATP